MKPEMKPEVVALEVAEVEFDRFMEAMDLEVDLSVLDDEDRKSFDANKRKFVRAVQRGQLTVNEKGEPVFMPQSSDTAIVFHEPTGATLMALDQAKKGADVQKSFMMLAEMTRTPSSAYAKMPQRDLAVCQAVMVLFLASR